VNTTEGGSPALSPREAAAKAATEKFAATKPTDANAAVETKPTVETKPDASQATKPDRETDIKAAIELERAHRERERIKGEAELAKQRLEHYQAAEEARKADWRRALSDAGHNVEDVVMQWVGSDSPKPKGTEPTAPSGDRRYDQLMQEHETLKNEFNSLRDNLRQGASQYTRGQRLESLRGMLRGADDYEVVSSLEAEDALLSWIEGQEQQRGGDRYSDLELRDAIGGYESKSREQIEKQFRQLAKTKWGKTIMHALLNADAPAVEPSTTSPTRDLMNGDASGVTRTRLLSREEMREAARLKAEERIARRRQGLGA
jgi:hypothetical protein